MPSGTCSTSKQRRRTEAAFPPLAFTGDGHAALKVASRFGLLHLQRRVLCATETGQHIMPGNALLPAHGGLLITRGLAEWACLLPQELPFEAVARLLGWQTPEAQVLSSTTVRALVRSHGHLIAQAEQAEIATLAEQPEQARCGVRLVPHGQVRRHGGWPAELTAAVELALAREQPRPPEGVSWADWERVVAARRADPACPAKGLRHLGPQLAPGEVLLLLDEVLAPGRQRRHFQEVRTGRIMTAAGTRYLSGVSATFLAHVLALVRLCLGPERTLLLIADGARWIRDYFQEHLAALPGATMLLDWYHLQHKCADLGSRICRSRPAKAQFLRRLYRRLWAGDVPAALRFLQTYRPVAKDGAVLDTLISYLQARQAWIPNYRQRRRTQRYIGSGQVEKTNDLLVARRQKRGGMHWSGQTSTALATLRTLVLNGGWEQYWRDRRVLPLLAA
jgi:hypothetical protein